MSYEIIKYNARLWIKLGDRLLAGYTTNELRSYLFPLYTPSGALVLQESPPDHPHHQGVWCGLEVNGHDLWNAGSFAKPRHRQICDTSLYDLTTLVTTSGVQLKHLVRWVTVDGEELLWEQRELLIGATYDCTFVRWRSTFFHPQAPTHFGQTKESGIAIRVPPHFESPFVGRIRNRQGGIGEAETFDQLSPWVNVEGSSGGKHVAGIVLAPTNESETCPWFTRDYGIHVYNPARHRPFDLAPGVKMTWAVNVLAYDGTRTEEEIDALVTSCGMSD